ncbi:MAG: phospho-sugar mutase [Acidimicrobiales bacterium]
MIDPELRAVAGAWRDDDPDPATVAEVDALLDAGDEEALRDRFGTALSFGTAGLRGALGAGPNRMNRLVVRRTAAALARFLDDHDIPGPLVVGRDARHGSLGFAEDTAAVVAGTGREVVLIAGPVPTPLVAFAVGAVGAAAGVMVTASHNPPQDNGYKVYAADGAQIVPPADTEIATWIEAVGRASDLPLAPLDDPRIQGLPESVVDRYLDGIASLRVVPDTIAPLVAYTPMHGVALPLLARAFRRSGLDEPVVVADQAEPDPDFPTVAFPNPEEPGAMDRLLALAAERGADVALANDPDGDRLAVAVPAGTSWRPLTGDEIGILLADHLLRHGTGADRLVVTTVVSSSMLGALAARHGVTFVETLTGFKWLARAALARPDLRFVLGYEEALGYSIGTLVRDKDGISAAVVFVELVATLQASGSSVLQRLDELATDLGAHVTKQVSSRFEGLDGPDRMGAVVERLRARPPAVLGGIPLTEVEDLALGERLPSTDAVILRGPGLRVIVRPSGTEPKLKSYFEGVEPVTATVAEARARADERLAAVVADLAVVLA